MLRLFTRLTFLLALIIQPVYSLYFSPYGSNIPLQTLNFEKNEKKAKISFLGYFRKEDIQKQVESLKKTLELDVFPYEVTGSLEASFHNFDNNKLANLPYQIYFLYFSPTELDRFYLEKSEVSSYLRKISIFKNPLISSLAYYLDNSSLNNYIQSSYFQKNYKLAGKNEKITFTKEPDLYTLNMELQLKLFNSKVVDLIKKINLNDKKMAIVLAPVDLNYPAFQNCLEQGKRVPSAFTTIKNFNQTNVTNKDISLLKEKLERNALKSCKHFSHPIIINNLLKKLAKKYGIHTIHYDEISFNRSLDNNNTMGRIIGKLYKKFLRGH